MGSKTPIPQIFLQQCRLEPAVETMVTNLVNSVYYFLHHVLIINTNEDYRLLVIGFNKVLWDKNYKSIRGAKIAFSKLFGKLAKDHMRYTIWSHQYPPDDDWLRDLLKLSNNGN